jgi:hypothetical protein
MSLCYSLAHTLTHALHPSHTHQIYVSAHCPSLAQSSGNVPRTLTKCTSLAQSSIVRHLHNQQMSVTRTTTDCTSLAQSTSVNRKSNTRLSIPVVHTINVRQSISVTRTTNICLSMSVTHTIVTRPCTSPHLRAQSRGLASRPSHVYTQVAPAGLSTESTACSHVATIRTQI